VNLTTQFSKTLADLRGWVFDWVVTVCGHATEHCPMFPEKTKVLHVALKTRPR